LSTSSTLSHKTAAVEARSQSPQDSPFWAIKNNVSVPGDFETSRKRRVREAQIEDEAAEQLRSLTDELAYDQFCDEAGDERFAADYPGDRLESAVPEELRRLKREQPDWFSGVPDACRHEVAIGHLHSKVREGLDLPTFDRWSKSDLVLHQTTPICSQPTASARKLTHWVPSLFYMRAMNRPRALLGSSCYFTTNESSTH
jgi:hypothetical protein